MESTFLAKKNPLAETSQFVKEAKRALKERLQREKIEPDDVTGKVASESQPGAETALAP